MTDCAFVWGKKRGHDNVVAMVTGSHKMGFHTVYKYSPFELFLQGLLSTHNYGLESISLGPQIIFLDDKRSKN